MTTVSKQLPDVALHIFKGLAFSETFEMFVQTEGGDTSLFDLTGKELMLAIKTSSDAVTPVKTLSTTDGSIIAGNGFVTINAFTRAETLALPDDDLIGLLILVDSPVRDVPLVYIAFSVQAV